MKKAQLLGEVIVLFSFYRDVKLASQFFERSDLLGRTRIKIIRFYDGSKSAKEVMNEVITYKVRKKLNDDIENKRGKEYNLGNTQDKNYPSLSGLCG